MEYIETETDLISPMSSELKNEETRRKKKYRNRKRDLRRKKRLYKQNLREKKNNESNKIE